MKKLILLVPILFLIGCDTTYSPYAGRQGYNWAVAIENQQLHENLVNSQINYNNRVGVGRVPCERYDFTPTPILPSAIPQTPMNPGRSMGGPYTGNLGGIY